MSGEKNCLGKRIYQLRIHTYHEKEVFAERSQREIVGVATIHLVYALEYT